jgi:hypothetical protein
MKMALIKRGNAPLFSHDTIFFLAVSRGDERPTDAEKQETLQFARKQGGIWLLYVGQMEARCRLTLPLEFREMQTFKTLVIRANLLEQAGKVD